MIFQVFQVFQILYEPCVFSGGNLDMRSVRERFNLFIFIYIYLYILYIYLFISSVFITSNKYAIAIASLVCANDILVATTEFLKNILLRNKLVIYIKLSLHWLLPSFLPSWILPSCLLKCFCTTVAFPRREMILPSCILPSCLLKVANY